MSEVITTMDADWSTGYLLAHLDLLRARVRAVVAERRQADTNPDDPYRGLYVDATEADELIARGAGSRVPPPDPDLTRLEGELEARASALAGAGTDLRLPALAGRFGLDPLDVELLLAAIAPDLDPAFEKLYGYLNNDVTRRRVSVGLALEMCGASLADGRARSRLAAGSPLVDGLLVNVEDGDRPMLSRALRVPDRVVAHLLGDDRPDRLLSPLLVAPAPWPGEPGPALAGALDAGVDLLYVQEAPGTAGLSYLASAFAATGRPVMVVDLALLTTGDDLDVLAQVAAREARLGGRALVGIHVDALSDRGPASVRRWAELPGLVALTGSRAWDPRWSRRPPLLLDAPALSDGARLASWAGALGEFPPPDDLRRSVGAFRLTPEQVEIAARAAAQRAATRNATAGAEDLQAGARAQNAAGLEHLARRIAPRATWGDLVLPRVVEAQLRALAGRVRQRSRVLDDWRLASAASRGRGVTVLFAGDSGTGKTMSAEVVARSLGLDLYVIDLSTVVDKYIGETEKNLDRIFAEADRVNGVLLFDEADAIFGKRSEVKDARDRYANVEVAYLLQRMEQFEGVAILTTNLRANVDEAFLRRIDVLVEFSVPDPEARARLWAKQLRPQVPVTGDIDLAFLANSFEFSGGNIRNVVLAAAFEAAEADEAVSMAHLVRATAAEYRKLGRLTVEAEFGRYFAELRS
ncbi:MAG: ATP-binding protein [Acidimicrobiaceae bacterium]|nr:ATP-binding protein [Acidimicrobiaceae bacterium]